MQLLAEHGFQNFCFTLKAHYGNVGENLNTNQRGIWGAVKMKIAMDLIYRNESVVLKSTFRLRSFHKTGNFHQKIIFQPTTGKELLDGGFKCDASAVSREAER